MLNRLSLNIRRFLAGWWLRSRFFTYQSPLLLLELFEKLEHPRSPIERAPQRIKLGDTVSLVDAQRKLSFQVTLVTSGNQDEVHGGVTCDSLLGAALLGRRQHEVFELSIWGQRHCFAITHVKHISMGNQTKLCPCLLCQS
ncbi:GreA/GreB family elongation factor [Vibrio metoecus]|nr:GreA/GreB family elongation factor [Vibrio metoecus]MCR9387530.1 GreA/GreB family elongation factor [Vibrio metoecus]